MYRSRRQKFTLFVASVITYAALGIRLTVPRLSNEQRRGPFHREIYRQRNIVERAINKLKQFRRITTRYPI
ncbi:transposase [Tolypothrix bouteillei VB521301]|uniref:Transposase n=1 Tax=Tolypothrix bouteillei VB521301 TaxID=1479485 RepID=A0A8S9TD51_9CYAN|nr:transposase [Tolypothrix bouteillei VB521301]